MSFANPRMLWLLVFALPLLAWFLSWSWRRKQHLIGQFVQSRLLAQLTVGVSSNFQKTRLVLAGVAVAALIFALARPQSGFIWDEIDQEGLDIIIAVDTSRSMLANDISPDRLSRTKLAALDLLRLAKGDRLGLVAFAGTAFLQCPLTHDDQAFRESVNALEIGIIPRGGTTLKEAIDVASKAFTTQTENEKALILLTDGEDHEQGALQAARSAATVGVRIFTAGVGTEKGELLQQKDENGNLNYVKDAQGNVVKSRLNETLLTQIASVADGFYLPLSSPNAMDVLYQQGLAPIPKSPSSSKEFKRNKEGYQWPVALAIALLLLEMFLPDRRRGHRERSANIPSIGASFARGFIVLIILNLVIPVSASSRAAFKSYREGRYEEAKNDFEALLAQNPNDLRLSYNAGTAAYRAAQFPQAIRHFATAVAVQDLHLQHLSYYNLANSIYRFGETLNDLEQKQAAWEQSIRHYDRALKLDSDDKDAKFNRMVVQGKLDALKRQKSRPQDLKADKGIEIKKPGSDQQNAPQSKPEAKDPNRKTEDKSSPQKSTDREKLEKQPPGQPSDGAAGFGKQGGQAKDENQRSSGEGDPSETRPAAADVSANSHASMPLNQVIRLLDAQKSKESIMIFNRQETNAHLRPVSKDW